MPDYRFRTFDGNQSATSDAPICFTGPDVAWVEMVKVCADLVGSVALNLKENSDWHLELLDDADKPCFRINLRAESLQR
jgi:hypothetical protein